MAKEKRLFLSFEVTKEEEKLINMRAQQEGVSRSQYLREAFILEFFMSGDLECYKYMGRRASAALKEMLADKLGHMDRSRGEALLA